jgi:L-lactate dehydrogenase complex protein LldF
LPRYWKDMNNPFYSMIRAALENPGLQDALDANAEHRLDARKQAISSLDEDWETLRQSAHQVRDQTLSKLDEYLKKFIQKTQENGFIVHRATNAQEAVQIVLEVAKLHQAKLIIKAKSMVSEEIQLNRALENAGLQVVETDLGEFIIQLRGEHPAHIITPAVHLSRSEVGRTFQEKLGLPFTEDVSTMTASARKELRQIFLKADLGISGVNFGVAETGTLCIVTNEGNGRMVTTLPPVHIALMGLERLVPSMEDLSLMLTLLPRAATGQKISVYTSLIHGPRLDDEIDGAQERHLIILDNGREAVRNSPLKEALLCIRCGACLNVCPVFREIGGHAYVSLQGKHSTYPGPIGSVISPGLFGQMEFGHLAQASSLCGACKEACPVDIDLPKLLLRVRAGGVEPDQRHKPPGIPLVVTWGLQIFTWMAINQRRFAIAQKLVGLFGSIVAPGKIWLRLPAITGWGLSRDFPRPVIRTFRERWVSGYSSSVPEIQVDLGSISEIHSIDLPATNQLSSIGGGGGTQSLVDRFTSELRKINGTYTLCNKSELADKLIAFLHEREIRSIMSWEQEHLPDGLLEFLAEAGINVSHKMDASFMAGLTGGPAAFAKTGSIAIPAGVGKPLAVSLLPEIHLVVIRARQIYADLKSVIMHPEVQSATSAVLVSGPSRTADIEMTLTVGVHGPRQVHVFCLMDQ